jgi:hypothetical protein
MTTCAECLTELATTRLADINQSSLVVAHCSTCEQCARVAADLRVAEHQLAVSLAEARPGRQWSDIASDALDGSERMRRRNAARWIRGALGALALLILGTFVLERRQPAPALETKTIMLTCLDGDAATAVVTPYLRSSGSAVWTIPGIRGITVRGAHVEIEQSISEIDAIQMKSCGAPTPPSTPTTTPGAETPGKG